MSETNVGMVTQRITAIPAEKRDSKIKRTVGGILLAAAGFGMLYAQNRGIVAKELSVWFERVGVASIALGFLSASLEFVKLPLDYALALAKDIAKLVRGNGS